MNEKIKIAVLGLGHGLNDLVAGYFLGQLIYLKTDTTLIALGLLIYNILAFGGQYFVAQWLEKFNQPKKALLISYSMNIFALILFLYLPTTAIVLAGAASAIYHVAGGTVCARSNKAANIGLFAAPGVVGLIGGGYFAWTKAEILLPLTILAILYLFVLHLILSTDKKNTSFTTTSQTKNFALDRHDMIMILLLVIISMRSVIWNIFQLVHDNNYEWLLAIAGAAFIGKIVGGWLADRIGWRLYVFISLLSALPLVTFFKEELLLFCIGVGLLQSGIPATTSLLIRTMHGKTEQGISLSFGLAIFIGMVIMYTPFRFLLSADISIWVLGLAMIGLLFWIKARKRKPV